MERGVIIGCDANQEWLLPWFFGHYKQWNEIPLTFIDLGMSESGLRWCREKGNVISLGVIELEEKRRGMGRDLWEIAYGKGELQKLRSAWFKKPYAFLASPYEITLWLDLDCEVKKSLVPLFALLEEGSEIGMVKEERIILFSPAGLDSYNSGVVLFRKEAPILSRFLEFSKLYQDDYLGDQEILALAIEETCPKMTHLPLIYNWDWKRGESEEVAIYHHMGQNGKEVIRQKIKNNL